MKTQIDYLNMCKKVANSLTRDNRQDFEDYVQQGFLGVINAFERECPEGVDFDRFVWLHIKSAVWSYKLNDCLIPIKGRELRRPEVTRDALLTEEVGYTPDYDRVERIASHIGDEITR